MLYILLFLCHFYANAEGQRPNSLLRLLLQLSWEGGQQQGRQCGWEQDIHRAQSSPDLLTQGHAAPWQSGHHWDIWLHDNTLMNKPDSCTFRRWKGRGSLFEGRKNLSFSQAWPVSKRKKKKIAYYSTM